MICVQSVVTAPLVRAFESERRSQPVRDCLEDTSELLSSFWHPLRKRTRNAADSVRESVRDAVGEAVDRVRDIDVDPITKWWRKIW